MAHKKKSGIKIRFLGGTGTVTGSKYLVSTPEARILIDCGLFQGYKWLRERNWHPLPFALKSLDAVVLTHAHLDHSGYVPVLYRQGFRGPVYCHPATRDLCRILLEDSGHLQEEDAKYYQRHQIGKHARPKPLYDRQQAIRSCDLFSTVHFDETFTVGDLKITLSPAGHILGASSVILEHNGNRIGFSGDVGRPHDILMRAPVPLPPLDHLVLESTYGDRLHTTVPTQQQLAQVVNETANNSGVLLIPSFAVGRAQALQHLLSELKARGEIPDLPVYLDSPMAIDVSAIYCHYESLHRLTGRECQRFSNDTIYTRDVEQSMALADISYPHVIIAGSGMATGGRILHHLKRLVGNHRTTVLFTGYQAGGTRGAHMLAGAEEIKLHGQYLPVRARVEVLHGLSGHADYKEMLEWLQRSDLPEHTHIHLTHGEAEAADAFRLFLQERTPWQVDVPQHGDTLTI